MSIDDFGTYVHIVNEKMSERKEDIATLLMTDQLQSMEEYRGLMGELKFIADLEERIREANKEREEDG